MLDLRRWRKRPKALADYLTWGQMLDDSTLLNKDGAFMCCVRYRGHDIDTATKPEMMALRSRANNALRRLGSSWALHIEAQRVPSDRYPVSKFPDPVTEAFDEERRMNHSAVDAHFETHHFITFTYLPPSDHVTTAKQFLLEGVEPDSETDYQAELKQFKRNVQTTCDLLAPALISIDLLSGGDLLTYLHSTVTDHPIDLEMPEIPIDIDCLVANSRFVGGLAPRLGDLHLATIGVRSWPNATVPVMLDNLHSLGLPYRWVTRWIPFDREDGLRKVSRVRQLWFSKRKSVKTLLMEAVTKKESDQVDAEAVVKHADAEEAYNGLVEDLYSMGHFTLTITTYGTTPDEANARARQIRQITDGLGLVSTIESVNAVDAWLGSLPGNPYADARRPLVHSMNLTDLMPLTSVWAGEERCDHLDAPSLFTASARGATPFRLNLYDDDVGHTMVLGPTGAGKSTLLGTIAAQFRRYEGAQVYFFDFGKSSRALTMAVGGEFHDVGSSLKGQGLKFQPLRNLAKEKDRVWARDWIVELCELSGVKANSEQQNAIWNALLSIASLKDPCQRTLSNFRSVCSDSTVKGALRDFVLGGPYGQLLDNDEDTLGYATWQAFEMEGLKGSPKQLTPVLLYIFHVLEQRFATETVAKAPTLLILDEAWSFLDNSLFAAQIREWLKTLRKRNVAVVFATQSVSDVASSSIASALVESCPTTILLPNAKALEPSTADIYRSWGLTEGELQVLSEALPKREYYVRSRRGQRLIDLELGNFALHLVGASSKNDQTLMDEATQLGLSGEKFAAWFMDKRQGGDTETPTPWHGVTDPAITIDTPDVAQSSADILVELAHINERADTQ